MPLATIWRSSEISNDQTIKIRDELLGIIASFLQVHRDHVEVRVRDNGPLDINNAVIGIEVDTGSGRDNFRITDKKDIVKRISAELIKTGVIPQEWLSDKKSYVWLRICESAFIPIGFPEEVR